MCAYERTKRHSYYRNLLFGQIRANIEYNHNSRSVTAAAAAATEITISMAMKVGVVVCVGKMADAKVLPIPK